MTKRTKFKSERDHPEDLAKPNDLVAPRRMPLWQALLLPLAAILVFFLLLEGGLTLFGVKPALQSEDPFVGFASNVPLFVPQPASENGQQMTTATNRLTFFNKQTFSQQKQQGSYRVFCLGGSTTYGRPYSDTTSFAGWLRELLPVADSHKQWEVINAGGISYASYRVAHLMEELVQYQPDLFIIYTGHNEFLEERTYGTLRDVPTSIRSTVSLLARTRTWSAMDSALKGLGIKSQEGGENRDQLASEVNTILARSAGPERYNRDDQLQANILQHYRVSLERMTALARSVGAEIIFVTPASNLKDSSPFKSEHTAGLDVAKQQQSEQTLNKAKEAIRREDWSGALELLDTAVALDPRHAEILYRRGQTLLNLNRYDEAATALSRARDEDVCPLRALSPMRQVVTDVAREQGAALVDFVDLLQRQMKNIKGYSVPGQEYFLDHVHPTIEGNKILAIELIQTMTSLGLVQLGSDWGAKTIAEVEEIVEGRVDQRVHGQALANLARVLNWAGKTEDAERLAMQALTIAGEYPEVASNAASILTTISRRRGQPERALEQLYTAIETVPQNMELRFKLGLLQIGAPFRQMDKAAANLLLASKQMPLSDMVHLTFGLAMAERGRLRIAYPYLLEALRLNPKNIEAEESLGKMRMVLNGQLPSPQLPRILREDYPSGTPHKMVQISRNSSGRDLRDGIEVEWHENGRVKRLRDNEQGVPNGIELIWGSDGRLLSRVRYDQGVPIENESKR